MLPNVSVTIQVSSPVPPAGKISADPLLMPVQVAEVVEIRNSSGGGASMRKGSVVRQPLSSIIDATYSEAQRLS